MYRCGWGRPTWKALKGYNAKIQAQVVGERGPKKGQKNLECQLEGKPNKPNNAYNVEPNRAKKIRPHNWNMEHRGGPYPYPQGMMKHYKGHKPLK